MAQEPLTRGTRASPTAARSEPGRTRWNLTTNVEHAGWLHATRDGFRATIQGEAALDEHPDPQDFFQASVDVYYEWDTLRKATLEPPMQPSTAITHVAAGSPMPAAPLARAAAWQGRLGAVARTRRGVPRRRWHCATTCWQRRTLTRPCAAWHRTRHACWPRRCGCSWWGRSRHDRVDQANPVRGSLLRMVAFAAGPAVGASAHLEQGFVHAGQALIATPWVMLSSFAHLLVHWHEQPYDVREAVWDDPWAFRDLAEAAPGVDPRVAALLCVVVHPAPSPPCCGRRTARRSSPRSVRTRTPTGDVEKDLKTITLRLQAEAVARRSGTTRRPCSRRGATTRAARLAGPRRGRPAEPGPHLGAAGDRVDHRRQA